MNAHLAQSQQCGLGCKLIVTGNLLLYHISVHMSTGPENESGAAAVHPPVFDICIVSHFPAVAAGVYPHVGRLGMWYNETSITGARMLTLKEATDLLKATGARDVRMTRSYKRNNHREVLIEAFLHKGDGARNAKAMKELVRTTLSPIAAQLQLQLQLDGCVDRVWSNWSENNLKLEMFCKVCLPEEF